LRRAASSAFSLVQRLSSSRMRGVREGSVVRCDALSSTLLTFLCDKVNVQYRPSNMNSGRTVVVATGDGLHVFVRGGRAERCDFGGSEIAALAMSAACPGYFDFPVSGLKPRPASPAVVQHPAALGRDTGASTGVRLVPGSHPHRGAADRSRSLFRGHRVTQGAESLAFLALLLSPWVMTKS